MERGGTDQKIGVPVGFIEIAWRRYTKHSRNKAQEIQGAVLPLLDTHRNAAPFAAAILAGIFTDGALEQLRSQGFSILYFPYSTVIDAFRSVGIDAEYGESTPDADIEAQVQEWEALSAAQRTKVGQELLESNAAAVERFVHELEIVVTRQVKYVRVLPLYGSVVEKTSVEEAINYVEAYGEDDIEQPFAKYEIDVMYNNGNEIKGQFHDKESAVEFLRNFAPATLGAA
jgi:hypothetical protein